MRDEVEGKLERSGLVRGLRKNLSEYYGNDGCLVERNGSAFPLPEEFEKFTTAALEKKTRKGNSTPRHPFFNSVR